VADLAVASAAVSAAEAPKRTGAGKMSGKGYETGRMSRMARRSVRICDLVPSPAGRRVA
jgi:hypothetical protein